MTISPPAKVKTVSLEESKVLCSGIDTLYLAINVKWKESELFKYLEQHKNIAIDEEREVTVKLKAKNDSCLFNIQPYGTQGYQWFLLGHDYALKIGNWMEPKSRPSIQAEIRSEALWSEGPRNTVKRLLNLLNGSGAEIEIVKPSRVDLCLDMIFPEELWNMELINYRVTRASYAAPHFYNSTLTGISIGKGKLSARLYDKILEINQKSKKTWMHEIWGINSPPEGCKIIRFEFQIRREAIKELGLNTIADLLSCSGNLWAYCTEKWLKFQNSPGKHHTQRKTFDWWQIVQKGYSNEQKAFPLIRAQAYRADVKRLCGQIYGSSTSMLAVKLDSEGQDIETVKPEHLIEAFKDGLNDKGITDEELSQAVMKKRARYGRRRIKAREAEQMRRELGFPVAGYKREPSP